MLLIEEIIDNFLSLFPFRFAMRPYLWNLFRMTYGLPLFRQHSTSRPNNSKFLPPLRYPFRHKRSIMNIEYIC